MRTLLGLPTPGAPQQGCRTGRSPPHSRNLLPPQPKPFLPAQLRNTTQLDTHQEETGAKRLRFPRCLSSCCLEIPIPTNLLRASEVSVGTGIGLERLPKGWCLGQQSTLLPPQLSSTGVPLHLGFQQLDLIFQTEPHAEPDLFLCSHLM